MISIEKGLSEEAKIEDQFVTIPIGEYVELIWHDNLRWMLVEALLDGAEMSWNDQLTFNDTSIREILRYSYPDLYRQKLDELKEAQAIKQRAEDKKILDAEINEMISVISTKESEEEA